jgi:hypothetical protein
VCAIAHPLESLNLLLQLQLDHVAHLKALYFLPSARFWP